MVLILLSAKQAELPETICFWKLKSCWFWSIQNWHMKNPPMKYKHFCMWCYRSQELQNEVKSEETLHSSSTSCFHLFHPRHYQLQRQDISRAMLSFFPEACSLSALGGKARQDHYIILLSQWHGNWSQTGWVIETFLFKNFNKEEKVLHLTPISSCLHLFILYLK